MKKIYTLLLVTVFCLVVCGSAMADTLAIWGKNPTTSDSNLYGTGTDRMDSGNKNEVGNWASTEVDPDISDPTTLTVTINNGYPGYQSYINATIVNNTDASIKVTDSSITVTNPQGVGSDPGIFVKLMNMKGSETEFKDTVPFDIAARAEVPVRLIVRVRQIAAENSTYRANVKITVQQDRRGGDDDITGDDDNNITGDDDDTTPEPIVNPTPPAKEPMKLPVVPVELPYTGANVALFTGTGLALGGFGLIIRRKK